MKKESKTDIVLLVVIVGLVCMISSTFLKQGFAQLDSPYANCISLFMAGDAVQLTEGEDCNSSQWQEAVQYYKANGYPHENSYMNFGYGKFIELDSDKFVQDKKDLGMH